MSSPKRPCAIFFLLCVLATSCSGDTSGVGAFARVAVDTDLYEVSGTAVDSGRLMVEEIRPLRGSIKTDLGSGSEVQVNDIFDYAPPVGEPIQAILAYNQEENSYRYVYIHDPETDEPIESFPTEKTETGMTPVELLDCLAIETESSQEDTRFDTVVTAIDTDDVDAIWRCGT